MKIISRLDAAMWGVFDCTCCGDGCTCGCVELCPVGLERHEAFRAWLDEDDDNTTERTT